jgi:hypothetical protein
MPKTKNTTPATPATPAKVADTFSPAMKLERLSVREKIKSALGLPKEAITSREAGYIDLVVAPSMFTPTALLAALKAACSTNGIQCQIRTEAVEKNGVVTLSFTNDLMVKQGPSANGGLGWGARGNSRQARVLTATPAPVAPVVAPESQPATKAGKGKKAGK